MLAVDMAKLLQRPSWFVGAIGAESSRRKKRLQPKVDMLMRDYKNISKSHEVAGHSVPLGRDAETRSKVLEALGGEESSVSYLSSMVHGVSRTCV